MSDLTIRYEPDPDDEVGELWFTLTTESFSGTAFFWSNLAELPSIIDKLKSYPLRDPVRWTWGYDNTEGADLVLALSIAQDGGAGRLEATVEMADLYDTSCRLATKLPVDYNALDTLRAGLEQVLEHRTGECILLGK